MLSSLGLGGDGDEVDAIERVGKRFGIAFDHSDYERFETVGDVWLALLDKLGEEDEGHRWASFVEALGGALRRLFRR